MVAIEFADDGFNENVGLFILISLGVVAWARLTINQY